ncbi:transcriptional repressor [Chitinophaga sp. LS1]|uniref:transcriptional repressor n=1 Tax=Chitinophaga sp. LS1 TaxID=3051176 RepID=UPI002AAAA5CC|nr:transcriptional repressor [Chitinophaga sp. LS1]WPV64590.1 transcriptional repressor [Chitinophaga sp. LS1]
MARNKNTTLAEMLLSDGGLKVTPTRKAILEIILRNGYSMTNKEINCSLKNKMSRSIIYRTLQLFVERRVLCISPLCGRSLQYCIALHNSSILHFQCEKCRTITVSDAGVLIPNTIQDGNIVRQVFYRVKGLCQNCC